MDPTPSKTFLVVEDIIDLQQMFVIELQKHFPNCKVIAVATLDKAREAVKSNTFSAIITDCGFPENEQTPRLHGNTCGLTLIKEVRQGKLGTTNQQTLIAFNSAEMDVTKTEDALNFGGKTNCFKKGAIYPTIRGKNASQYTIENVTAQTIRWLKEQFEAQALEPPPAVPKPGPRSFGQRLLDGLGLGQIGRSGP